MEISKIHLSFSDCATFLASPSEGHRLPWSFFTVREQSHIFGPLCSSRPAGDSVRPPESKQLLPCEAGRKPESRFTEPGTQPHRGKVRTLILNMWKLTEEVCVSNNHHYCRSRSCTGLVVAYECCHMGSAMNFKNNQKIKTHIFLNLENWMVEISPNTKTYEDLLVIEWRLIHGTCQIKTEEC